MVVAHDRFFASVAMHLFVIPFLLILRFVHIQFSPLTSIRCSLEDIGPGAKPYSEADVERCQVGRMGVMFIVLGLSLLYDTFRLWVPAVSVARPEPASFFHTAAQKTALIVSLVGRSRRRGTRCQRCASPSSQTRPSTS